MLNIIERLIDYSIEAKDGDIGNVEDLYFDDESWTIRYLVVKTGNWFSGRKVLISPIAIGKRTGRYGTFPVALTMEQVKNSPDIDTEKPVSRQQEAELATYYPWQNYWGTGFYPAALWGVIPSTPSINAAMIREPKIVKHPNEDLHLRSCHKVTGYHIHASDGDIGHVNDFIMDDQTWQIAYLVIVTHNWLGGKKVMVPVLHIQRVQWEDSKVFVDMSIDAVKSSMEFDESKYRPDEIEAYAT